MTRKSISFLVLLSSFFLSISALAQVKKEDVIAKVGNRTITVEDFNRRYNEVKNTFNPPTKKQFLEDLVRFEMGLAEASLKGTEKDPIYQEKIKAELYKSYLEKELGEDIQKIPVSEKEMEAFYKQNPEIRFSTIIIELKPGATPAQKAEAKKRATEIYDEVKKSKRPFDELVRLYSDDMITKPLGGDAGFQSRVTLTPTFYEAVSEMKVGDIKGLIETPFGMHIVKLTARRSFSDADKRQLRMAVHNEKRIKLFNDHFAALKKKYPTTVNSKLIE